MNSSITKNRRRFAILGDPVAHSKSPLMHAAAYLALRMPHVYERIRVESQELERYVAALRDGEFDGLNVTVPYKVKILDFVDARDASTVLVGAANTLVRNPSGAVIAHNTDMPALVSELTLLAPLRAEDDWRNATAIVLGMGGAARSAVAALGAGLRVKQIVVRSRSTKDRADAFCVEMRELLQNAGATTRVDVGPWHSQSSDERNASIIVQATSAGMHGAESGDTAKDAIAWDALSGDAIALDVIYAPAITPFLAAAHARGLRAANGFGMLARQGALAFELWLGIPAPYDVMLRAIVKE